MEKSFLHQIFMSLGCVLRCRLLWSRNREEHGRKEWEKKRSIIKSRSYTSAIYFRFLLRFSLKYLPFAFPSSAHAFEQLSPLL